VRQLPQPPRLARVIRLESLAGSSGAPALLTAAASGATHTASRAGSLQATTCKSLLMTGQIRKKPRAAERGPQVWRRRSPASACACSED
jgi:hypothetical protein